MKALVFLSHPAHYHLFRGTIESLAARGHQVRLVAVKKDVLETLLQDRGWAYDNLAPRGRRVRGLPILANAALTTLVTEARLLGLLFRDRPDVLAGTELTLAHVGRLTGIPSVLFNEDDTAATPENRFFYPFADHLVLPGSCDPGLWPHKRISYPGYHELAYLHPDRFTPDPAVVARLIPGEEPFAVLRLAELTASHDSGKTGIADGLAGRLLKVMAARCRVVVTAERPLAPEFEAYRLAVPARDMHHFLAAASLYVGDSQTMTAEAAVLGTPALRFNDFVGRLGYLGELEAFGLSEGIPTSQPERLLERVAAVLDDPGSKAALAGCRAAMLARSVEPTALYVRALELAARRLPTAAIRRELAKEGYL